MSEIVLMKVGSGALIAADPESGELIDSWPLGQGVRAKVSRARNIRFFRKWFALIGVAFDAWCEQLPACHIVHDRVVTPDRERFRKDVTIMCGFYNPVWNARGEVRLEAKSIAFGNMDEEEFAKLYSVTINVILSKILPGTGWTDERLREAAEAVVEFA